MKLNDEELESLDKQIGKIEQEAFLKMAEYVNGQSSSRVPLSLNRTARIWTPETLRGYFNGIRKICDGAFENINKTIDGMEADGDGK